MRIKWKHVHIAIAMTWVATLVVLACDMALLGNETSRLGKQWGVEDNRERELNFELSQLRQQIDWKASRGYIEQKVRDLRLPIHSREDRELLARQP